MSVGPGGAGVAISLTGFPNLGPTEHQFCEKSLGKSGERVAQCGQVQIVLENTMYNICILEFEKNTLAMEAWNSPAVKNSI